MPVSPGDILRERFRIDALIGRGGMGHVYSATDLSSPLQVQFAVKVVSGVLVDKVGMARLHREAEAAQRIQSDFVPRVTEVNETASGETFLVMERLFGEPLSQRMRDSDGVLPWHEVMTIGEDVLRGLIDAHTAGIVHRDLKPSNVFLALKNGRVRAMVLDFGVCKLDGVDVERLTGTGESIGTVAYMAPEQIRGASTVDERADLYAFGVVVYEMLSGRLPHDGASQINILASKLEKEAPGLHHHARVPFPDGVAEILTRVLARDPAKRPASAQELLKAWRAIGTQRTLRTPAPMSSQASARPDDATSAPSLPPIEANPTETSLAGPASPRQQSNARLALALTAVSLVVGLGVVGFTMSRPSTKPAPAAAVAPAPSASSAAVAVSAEPPPAVEPGEPIELPDDAPVAPGDHGKPRPRRTAPTKPHTPPKITSQPRY